MTLNSVVQFWCARRSADQTAWADQLEGLTLAPRPSNRALRLQARERAILQTISPPGNGRVFHLGDNVETDACLMKCPECDCLYGESMPSERRRHRRIHDEVINGLRRPQLGRCNVVWSAGSRRVVAINSQSPGSHKMLAQEVSLIAAGDTDYSGVAYSANERPDERRIHLFLGVSDENRAKAYVCFEFVPASGSVPGPSSRRDCLTAWRTDRCGPSGMPG
jgi:hypothetical protein